MSSRKKRTKGRTKSKAALETERLKSNGSAHDVIRATSPKRGGLMTKMRGGFQGAVGGGGDQQQSSLFNQILWIAVIGAAVFFFARGF